jgi:GTP-binding protein HflX
VDISHDNYKAQLETTHSVLGEIGAAHIPVVHVFNKIDRVDDPFLGRILKQAYPGSIAISAYKPEDIQRLREHIYQFFAANFIRCKLAIPASDKDGVSLVYRNCMILNVDYARQDLAVFDVRVTKEFYPKLAPYRLESDEP